MLGKPLIRRTLWHRIISQTTQRILQAMVKVTRATRTISKTTARRTTIRVTARRTIARAMTSTVTSSC